MEKDYFWSFGKKCFGPVLLDFSIWLKKSLEEKDIDRVYFLARDGYIMKKAFDIINKENKIKSYYFYASRRSIIVPSLCKLENVDSIFDSIAFKKRITVKAFLKKVGLDEWNDLDVLKKYDLEYEKEYNIEDIRNNKKFLNEIWETIKSNSNQELHYFNEYIKKNEFENKVAIVDIGWYGTMQKSLEKICDNIDIYGFYMALVPNKGLYDNEKFKGFLTDNTHDIDIYNKMHYFTSLFEFLFLSQDGSVKRFSGNLKNVELYDYEYKDKNEAKYATILQDGALQYVKDNCNKQKFDNRKCLKKLFKVMLYPNYTDARILGDIEFVDDKRIFIAKPNSITHYIFHKKSFVKDFLESDWRIGFLKRLLKIILPYYYINVIIRKIFIKKEK